MTATLKLACLCALCGIGMPWWHAAQAASEDAAYDAAQAPAQAGEPLPAREWVAISNERLNSMRGGFDAGGLRVSFGIERMVYVDGQLVATTHFNIPDLANITSQQARAIAAALGSVTLVQNGPGNAFQPGQIPATTLATVIQNSLSNQVIRSATTVNAAVNSLGMLKDLNAAATLNSALMNAAAFK